jgi:CubicO group peptidase (beta-lactamase class C family)
MKPFILLALLALVCSHSTAAGVLAAAAVEDGLIRWDDKACESLTEWRSDPIKSQITYRRLLTLTSGLTPGERGEGGRNPAWKEIVAKPMSGKPGGQFEYGAYHLNAFGEALQRCLKNETFEQYLVRRVLKPLGITLEWRVRCPDGNPQLGGGGAMTASDWARFGEFMRLQGQWNGRQLIAKESLAVCLRGTKQNPAYGLTWWLREPVPDAIIQQVPILQRDMGDIVTSDWLPEDLFMAAGAGKQRLYVIPSLKMVAVRQGDIGAGRSFHDDEFLNRLLRGQANETASPDSPQTPRGGRDTSGTSPTGGPDALVEGFLNRNDVNHDGKLSPAEMPGQMKQVFGRFDMNHDGFLDAQELKAFGERVRSSRRQ